jgi:glycosyltransferase involved in cell wall biosynthesis
MVESFIRVLRTLKYDAVFLQRNLIATLSTWEPLLKKPLLFDVDDAIFLGPRGATADRIARHASITVCGNSFLADHFSGFSQVEILPTAVDTDRFVPGRRPSAKERPVIGWSGSSSGFKYLEMIQPALRHVLMRHPDALFKVVSDRRPTLSTLPESQVVYEPWNHSTEVGAIQDFTVGIMPLEDTLWERGKCSYKMLTYMAVGVPTVVSPVGMNAEVLALGNCGYGVTKEADWIEALSNILSDSTMADKMGQTGRAIIEKHYSRHIIGQRLAQILRSFV